MTAPTAFQTAAWEALHQAQSVTGAAELVDAIPEVTRKAIKEYMRKQGIEGPVPFTRGYRKAPDRVATLTAQNARLRSRLAVLEAELAVSRQRLREDRQELERLRAELARRPTPITHRRIADGGIGGKRERRAAA